jgi:hypothetical protein
MQNQDMRYPIYILNRSRVQMSRQVKQQIDKQRRYESDKDIREAEKSAVEFLREN